VIVVVIAIVLDTPPKIPTIRDMRRAESIRARNAAASPPEDRAMPAWRIPAGGNA
jgi:hypothetical protein